VRRFRLEGRNNNFFGFESELIGSDHTGFLCPVSKNVFQLSYNPFVKPRTNYLYVIPESKIPTDLYLPYQLDASLVSSDIIPDAESTTGDYGRRFYYVERVNRYCNLPKPHIDAHDLTTMVSSAWNNADEDLLGTSIVLLLLSSPKIFSTSGGLGGESYFISENHTQQALRNHLHKTIFFNLPTEIKRQNSHTSYNIIGNETNAKRIADKIKKKESREVTYNSTTSVNYFPLVFEVRTPTVPLVIRESSPYKISKIEQYPDAIEWILRAQFIRPNSTDSIVKQSNKLAHEYNSDFEDTLGQLGYTFNEINMSQSLLSLSRLHLSSEFDSSMIKDYDKLLRFTSENIKSIIKELEGRDRLKKNPYLRYPEEFRIVIGSLCKLYQMYHKGIDLKEVEDDIGYLVDNKKIKKSIDVARIDGYIYSIEDYIDMKPVYSVKELLRK
jgi:hypothetical protein